MLRSATGGFRAYRDHFGWPGDEEQKANPWVVLIPASLQKFSELHRRMVYCVDYDGVWKNLCRAGNSAEEVLDEPPFKAMMDAMKEMITKENGTQVQGSTVGATGGPEAPSHESAHAADRHSVALNPNGGQGTPDKKLLMRIMKMDEEQRSHLSQF